MKAHAKQLTAGALVLAAVNAVYGQATTPGPEKPYTQPPADKPPAAVPAKTAEPGTLNDLFNGKLPEAIGQSKLSVNARLRYEYADQDSITPAADLKESNAVTLRTRFGLTTAPLYGFQGMIEGENVSVLGPDHNYNAAGSNGQGTRTVVADPETTELNQGWVSYANWDTLARGGRQRIVLDNHRFIGDVGWRQNQQTFDAATLENKSIKDLALLYGYLWEVNRVFGDVSGLPAANTDFSSSSHLVNASCSGCKYGKVVGYAYLLDLDNAAGTGQSCASYGASFAGSAPVHEKVKLDYRAEFAWQTDYADSPFDYETEYYNVELGVNVKPVVVGTGYEVLGSDNGQGFRTPLATLHAFNGWADVFLNTPAAGLRDLYAFAQVTLPSEIPVRVIYHKFEADAGSGDFGYEIDAVVSKKLGKHWTALVKYAYYDGADTPFAPAPPIDKQVFWAQLEFNY